MLVLIGSDHRGYKLKQALMTALPTLPWQDIGCHSEERTDYPIQAQSVAREVAAGRGYGVLICGSGVGMSIAANRFPGVYAALCHTPQQAAQARAHDNANILVLAANELSANQAETMLRVFLETPFLGGRYGERLCMLDDFSTKK